ncbi:MAG TPA: four helix bundle protein [Rhodanobacteraceae bacterium]|nr:four helix bundle protein [Rhodanobacteraceae bacterium]
MSSEGAPVRSYRDLIAWRAAMDLAERVYALSAMLPNDERLGLIQQLRRSVVSIPSNIAEGHARGATRDFGRFISISRGSFAEVETQLEMCSRLGMLGKESVSDILASCDELGRILTGLRKSLDSKLVRI